MQKKKTPKIKKIFFIHLINLNFLFSIKIPISLYRISPCFPIANFTFQMCFFYVDFLNWHHRCNILVCRINAFSNTGYSFQREHTLIQSELLTFLNSELVSVSQQSTFLYIYKILLYLKQLFFKLQDQVINRSVYYSDNYCINASTNDTNKKKNCVINFTLTGHRHFVYAIMKYEYP